MSLNKAIHTINATIDRIVQSSRGVSEDLMRWKPTEDKWSVIEVLCHVEEATLYWLKEIQSAVKAPGTEWGRGLQHEGRLSAVAEAGRRSTEDVLRGVERIKKAVEEVLSGIRDEELQQESPSRNPRFGTKPLRFIVDHLLVEHLDTHLKQIERNIRQYSESN